MSDAAPPTASQDTAAAGAVVLAAEQRRTAQSRGALHGPGGASDDPEHATARTATNGDDSGALATLPARSSALGAPLRSGNPASAAPSPRASSAARVEPRGHHPSGHPPAVRPGRRATRSESPPRPASTLPTISPHRRRACKSRGASPPPLGRSLGALSPYLHDLYIANGRLVGPHGEHVSARHVALLEWSLRCAGRELVAHGDMLGIAPVSRQVWARASFCFFCSFVLTPCLVAAGDRGAPLGAVVCLKTLWS